MSTVQFDSAGTYYVLKRIAGIGRNDGVRHRYGFYKVVTARWPVIVAEPDSLYYYGENAFFSFGAGHADQRGYSYEVLRDGEVLLAAEIRRFVQGGSRASADRDAVRASSPRRPSADRRAAPTRSFRGSCSPANRSCPPAARCRRLGQRGDLDPSRLATKSSKNRAQPAVVVDVFLRFRPGAELLAVVAENDDRVRMLVGHRRAGSRSSRAAARTESDSAAARCRGRRVSSRPSSSVRK